MNTYVTDGHLGGYVVGGDDATWYPDLWRWLVEKQHVRSVIDIGCGEGHALKFFRELGCRVLGIDGIRQDDPAICHHDFTLGPWGQTIGSSDDPWGVPADLIWCCEFVEHVEERYVPNFLAAFKTAKLVLMTHAEPGQDGYHHVNCQPSAYWIGAMAAISYELDQTLTMQTRALASINPNPWNHYVRSGLAFRRHS